MEEWIEVPFESGHPRPARGSGVMVNLLVSPYDVPEAVRGSFDKEKDRFVIEFKYIGSEPTEPRVPEQNFTLVVGKNSGRVYGIEIDVKALKAEQVGLQMVIGKELNRMLDHLVQQPITPSRQENYRLVRDAVSTTQDRLLQAVG